MENEIEMLGLRPHNMLYVSCMLRVEFSMVTNLGRFFLAKGINDREFHEALLALTSVNYHGNV